MRTGPTTFPAADSFRATDLRTLLVLAEDESNAPLALACHRALDLRDPVAIRICQLAWARRMAETEQARRAGIIE